MRAASAFFVPIRRVAQTKTPATPLFSKHPGRGETGKGGEVAKQSQNRFSDGVHDRPWLICQLSLPTSHHYLYLNPRKYMDSGATNNYPYDEHQLN